MIFRKQLLHNDCYRTVLGCLTDTEPQDVPHFMEDDINSDLISLELVDSINLWLRGRGMDMITVAYPSNAALQDLLDYIQTTQGTDIIYLLSGMSVTGNHVVICRGNKIIWDPSPLNSWIRGPSNGAYFVHYISFGYVRYNGPLPDTGEPADISGDEKEDSNGV